MDEAPLYRSRCTSRSLWQKYRIFADRLEMDTRFGLLTIPFENIEAMEIRASGHSSSLKGHLQLNEFHPALPLDWTNFRSHVVVDVNEGWMHRVFITPRDPAAFKSILDEAMSRHELSAEVRFSSTEGRPSDL